MKMYATYRRLPQSRVEDIAYWPNATSVRDALELSADADLPCGLSGDSYYGIRVVTVPGRHRCAFCTATATSYALISYRFTCASCHASGLATAAPLSPAEKRKMWCESVDRTVGQMLSGPTQSTLGASWLESPGRLTLNRAGHRRLAASGRI